MRQEISEITFFFLHLRRYMYHHEHLIVRHFFVGSSGGILALRLQMLCIPEWTGHLHNKVCREPYMCGNFGCIRILRIKRFLFNISLVKCRYEDAYYPGFFSVDKFSIRRTLPTYFTFSRLRHHVHLIEKLQKWVLQLKCSTMDNWFEIYRHKFYFCSYILIQKILSFGPFLNVEPLLCTIERVDISDNWP